MTITWFATFCQAFYLLLKVVKGRQLCYTILYSEMNLKLQRLRL